MTSQTKRTQKKGAARTATKSTARKADKRRLVAYQAIFTPARLWWSVSVVWILSAATMLIFAGPISWHVRAVLAADRVGAGFILGTVAGLALFAAVLAVVNAVKTSSRWAPLASLIAGGALAPMALLLFPAPFQWVFGAVGALAVLLMALELISGRGRQASKKAKGSTALLFPAGMASLSLGWLGAVIIASTGFMAPVMPPQLSGDAPTTIGDGSGVEVVIMYQINSLSGSVILADDGDQLHKLADAGTATFKLQAVAPSDDQITALPFMTGSACALEVAGQDGLSLFQRNYSLSILDGTATGTADELTLASGKKLGADFATCLNSGKYHRPAADVLNKTSVKPGTAMPIITVDGEKVEPETTQELIKLINEAAAK